LLLVDDHVIIGGTLSRNSFSSSSPFLLHTNSNLIVTNAFMNEVLYTDLIFENLMITGDTVIGYNSPNDYGKHAVH